MIRTPGDSDISCIENVFIEQVQKQRIAAGQCPARRPVFLRLHGVAHAQLEVLPAPAGLAPIGLFAKPAIYPAWVRFSSDIPDQRADLKSTVGISFKLFDVPGEKALEPDSKAPTLDFLFQNFPVFFVNDAGDFCSFLQDSEGFIAKHPLTGQLLNEMEKVVPSALGEKVWSVIPFKYGDTYCKYILEPEQLLSPGTPDYTNPTYLAEDLQQRLAAQPFRYRLLLQRQLGEVEMPLDSATVRWDETRSVPVHVATLVIPAQDITMHSQAQYGEALAFNPARTLKGFEAVGSIADARRHVYRVSADLRRNVNGQTVGEPQVPRPVLLPVTPPAELNSIVRAAIHPAIGIARLGNSQRADGYFIGPETCGQTAIDAQAMRDPTGAIKRQAARFRIYGYNAAGAVVAELTGENATLQWNVHLANRKAQWYTFQLALDVPAASELQVPLRNPQVTGNRRNDLAIDPGPRSISGLKQHGTQYHFNTGTFLGTAVPLGELRTDEAGRLLVLGGHGRSGSPEGTPIFDPHDPATFANAPGWYDDTSDGPVTASVSINGKAIEVESAWVVCAQPDYSPNTLSWRTMYDLMFDTYVQHGWLEPPAQVSFSQHILPILLRMSDLQWVNKGFAAMFGVDGPFDFSDLTLLGKLAAAPQSRAQDTFGQLRRTVYNAFRAGDTPHHEPRSWPWIYGDTFGEEQSSATDLLSASSVRDRLMARWVAGDFVNDWDDQLPAQLSLADVELAKQPAMLDQAALDHCVADAFHPGIELSWPMRNLSLYRAPWRIKHAESSAPEPDYGPTLSQAQVLCAQGPLGGQRPGGLSRWMALPWQVDATGCRSGYDPEYDPYLPTFWPARVPNQVLTEEDYQIAIDASQPREQRLAAFHRRAHWDRNLAGRTFAEKAQSMTEHFGDIGIVGVRPGVADDPQLPRVMQVESRNASLSREPSLSTRVPSGSTELDHSLHEAGWESLEHYNEAMSRFGR